MPRLTDVLLSTVLRTGGFVAVYLAFAHLVTVPGDDDGLATGLLAFLVFVLMAALWGGYDGWRWDFVRLALVWVATGVLFGLALAVLIQVPGEIDVDVLVTDLASSTPFFAGLVAVPAIGAGALVGALKRGTSQSG